MELFKNMAWALAIAGTLVTVMPGEGWAIQQGDLGEGANVYGATCGRCHNPRSPVERSDREWLVIINHMRVRASLTGAQVRDVLTFLQATNQDAPRGTMIPAGAAVTVEQPADLPISTDPAVVAEGRALVSTKGCIGCHAIAGAGGQVGPDLNGVIERRGAVFVRQKVLRPSFDNEATLMPNLGLNPDELEALVAYLATLR